METITRTVRDIDLFHRQAIEEVIGHALSDDQRLIISIQPSEQSVPPSAKLPEWLNLYQGLSDPEIDELEDVILQRDRSTRLFE